MPKEIEKMRLIDADALKAEFTGNFQTAYQTAEIHAIIDTTPTPDFAYTPIFRAEWIFDRPHHYKCSHCGLMWGDSALMMHYCPKCGSEMSPDYKVCWPDSPKKIFHREDKP